VADAKAAGETQFTCRAIISALQADDAGDKGTLLTCALCNLCRCLECICRDHSYNDLQLTSITATTILPYMHYIHRHNVSKPVQC